MARTLECREPGRTGRTARQPWERIQSVIARLNESETRLIETENRAKNAKIRNARLLAQIATYKQTIEDLKTAAEQQRAENEAIIADQRNQIATLSGEVDNLNVNAARSRHCGPSDRVQEPGLLCDRHQG